ncbi:hypothetical protein MTR67_048520 [Solanum verrucosum]|uniref:Reverse transcriptase domain-containing protein n=1 Tax=Solanum verrucosum TaxID=315347 RepID=A0AAF0UYJ2_SOLVR|nr:hypothetical protein MTR67_048520 [Solanum verrucosum]
MCKLDIEKAYDHANWKFLLNALEKSGWVGFISASTLSVFYSGECGYGGIMKRGKPYGRMSSDPSMDLPIIHPSSESHISSLLSPHLNYCIVLILGTVKKIREQFLQCLVPIHLSLLEPGPDSIVLSDHRVFCKKRPEDPDGSPQVDPICSGDLLGYPTIFFRILAFYDIWGLRLLCISP